MTDASLQQKPSYTDQAKTWTAKVADNLHGQAEYLKNKVAGPSTTTVQSYMLCQANVFVDASASSGCEDLRSLCSYGKILHSILNLGKCM